MRAPKPMVEIGGKRIILHVMDIHSRYGFTDFVVACGYEMLLMKKFFHDLHFMTNDFTVAIGNGRVASASISAVSSGRSKDGRGRSSRRRSGAPDRIRCAPSPTAYATRCAADQRDT
ncbi:hypothetical protein [Sphingomonas sp.]|uniref:hypothetical protein n=1 Tax=Sphingomonas sp. TaxID=28214 RepID=UPI0031D00BE8